jgi:hypothetical protein
MLWDSSGIDRLDICCPKYPGSTNTYRAFAKHPDGNEIPVPLVHKVVNIAETIVLKAYSVTHLMEEKRNACRVLVGMPEGNGPLERHRCR